jgi:hypothetical protein
MFVNFKGDNGFGLDFEGVIQIGQIERKMDIDDGSPNGRDSAGTDVGFGGMRVEG